MPTFKIRKTSYAKFVKIMQILVQGNIRMKQKILAIGDTHGRDDWKEFYKNSENYDKIIFLGDYVDSFHYSDEHIIKQLEEIIAFKKIFKTKVELLYGNHDFQYFINLPFRYSCSGYRISYANKLHDIFKQNKDLFKIAYQAGDTLLTHAGLTYGFWNMLKQHNTLSKAIDFNITKKNSYADVLNACFQANPLVFWSVSYFRGGGLTSPSPIWSDIRDFLTPASIKQHETDGKLHLSKEALLPVNQTIGHMPVKRHIKLSQKVDNKKVTYTWIDTGSYEVKDTGNKWINIAEDKPWIELTI